MTTKKPLHVGPTRKKTSKEDDCGCGKRVKVNSPVRKKNI